jgi:thiaminase/transcriptional activator TenA
VEEEISLKLRKEAGSIWKKIFEHPFVVELFNGALPLSKFNFYVLQDYRYLVAMIKNLGILTSKIEDANIMEEVVEILYLEATSEFTGYKVLLKELNHTLEDAINLQPAPINVAYANFLINTSLLRPFPEGICAIAPCFLSYAEIANYHRGKLKDNKNEIYVKWASVYFSDNYLLLVDKIKRILNGVGANYPYEKLRDVFILASEYEYMYWDAMYREEIWP